MDAGRWVLLIAVVGALLFGGWRAMSDGRFGGTRRLRRTGSAGVPSNSPGTTTDVGESLLAGTTYDVQRGERATLLQFSSAFCAPCRATRRVLADVSSTVPGVKHVEIDAEHHLELVRRLGIVRTPTTVVLDAGGRELSRASGAPRPTQVLAALDGAL